MQNKLYFIKPGYAYNLFQTYVSRHSGPRDQKFEEKKIIIIKQTIARATVAQPRNRLNHRPFIFPSLILRSKRFLSVVGGQKWRIQRESSGQRLC